MGHLCQETAVPIKAAVANIAPFEDYLEKFKVDNADDLREKYTRCVWWARRHGSAQTACPPSCAGQVQYQFEGSRIIAVLGLADLAYYGDTTKENRTEQNREHHISVISSLRIEHSNIV